MLRAGGTKKVSPPPPKREGERLTQARECKLPRRSREAVHRSKRGGGGEGMEEEEKEGEEKFQEQK